MNKLIFLVSVLLVVMFTGCTAVQVPGPRVSLIKGDFAGTITAQGHTMVLVLHLNDTGTTLDSVTENAMGIPLVISAQTDTTITLVNDQYSMKMVLSKNTATGALTGTFEQGSFNVPLVFNPGADIGHLIARPQDPQAPFPYDIQDISFVSADGTTKLAGTLTVPPGTNALDAVVLVTGSGAQDRNETLLGHKPFWVIADALGRAGIAVLRYDDRGTAFSGGVFATATTADFAKDAQGAIVALRAALGARAGKIGMLGHSEGGLVAPAVQANYHSLDFLILFAGPGIKIVDLVIRQSSDLARVNGASEAAIAVSEAQNREIGTILCSSASIEEQKAQIRAVLVKYGASNEQIDGILATIMAPWYHYFIRLDPADALSQVTIPVLALGGSKDLQVWSEGNLAAIASALKAAGNQDVTTTLYPGLNHLFQTATTGAPSEYDVISETIAPQVLVDIKNWIVAHH